MEYTILEKVKIRLRQFHINAVAPLDGDNIVFDNVEDNPILEVMIEQNKDLLMNRVRPPDYYTQEQREQILEEYKSAIVEMTLYDKVKEGGEFEKSHNEPGITRSWIDKDEILDYFNVKSFAKIVSAKVESA